MRNDTVLKKFEKCPSLENYAFSQRTIIANADTSKMKPGEIKRIEWSGEVSDIVPTRGDIGINKDKKVFCYGRDGKWFPYSF